MRKSRVRMLRRISAAAVVSVFCTSLFTASALAASPQENSLKVAKALLKMQKELLQKEHVNDNRTKVHQPVGHTNAGIRKVNQQAKLKINKPRKVAEAVKPTVENNEVAQKRHKQLKPKKTYPKKVSSAVINAISLKGNELDVSYSGTLNYDVLRDTRQKIVALDIIAPSFLPPQFATSFAIKLTTSQKGPVKYAVACFHKSKKDRLFLLYHKPFLRVSLCLKSFNGYKVEKFPGMLKILVKGPVPHNNPEKVSRKAIKIHSNTPYVSKSTAKRLTISLKSISRIVSPYPIEQVIYSKEQRIQVQVDGENIYIKPLPMKILLPDGSFALQYSSEPKDIYVITDKKVYSLHLVPKDIPSVTYKLKPVNENNKEVSLAKKLLLESIHGGTVQRPVENSYVAHIIYLLKQVYTGNLPPDYTLFHLKNSFTVSGKYEVKGEFEVSTGEGSVDVYKVTALENGSVDEKDFVPYLGDVSAVMLTSRHMLKGDSAYLYAVYAGGEYEQ